MCVCVLQQYGAHTKHDKEAAVLSSWS